MKHPNVYGFVDLACETFGAQVLHCTDDFFAEKENLIKASEPVFLPDEYTDRGKWMDGWESRRKRTAGHDTLTLQLGQRGNVGLLNVDTSHFLGNHPPYCRIESVDHCVEELGPLPENLDELPWEPLLDEVPLKAGSANFFHPTHQTIATHLRLHIYPDGGVARLRAYGRALPIRFEEQGGLVDLAAAKNGAQVLVCSDMFFGDMNQLILPADPRNMGEGWETRRRRGPGEDWCIIRLAGAGRLEKAEIYTQHFKGNYPDTAELYGLAGGGLSLQEIADPSRRWQPLLAPQKLGPDGRFAFELQGLAGAITHAKLVIRPDGGVSRLRLWGNLEPGQTS